METLLTNELARESEEHKYARAELLLALKFIGEHRAPKTLVEAQYLLDAYENLRIAAIEYLQGENAAVALEANEPGDLALRDAHKFETPSGRIRRLAKDNSRADARKPPRR